MGEQSSAGRRPRNTERTRRQILDSTRRLLVEHGTGITVALAAEAAGVSKSGLLHHFGSREQLLREVLEDTYARLRADVMDNLDLSENTPGKLLRAYVRTICSPDNEVMIALGAGAFWAGLEGIDGAEASTIVDLKRWDADFSADGLDADLIRIVRRAAEGLSTAFGYGDETAEDLVRAGERLVALTYQPAPW